MVYHGSDGKWIDETKYQPVESLIGLPNPILAARVVSDQNFGQWWGIYGLEVATQAPFEKFEDTGSKGLSFNL